MTILLRKKNILLSVLLTAILAITSFIPVAVSAQSFGSFSLEFLDDTTSGSLSSANRTDLSGIKVDVYDSVLERYDKDIGGYLYGHNYVNSVYTKADGTVTFSKPSGVFLIMVDLATLPSGIGINKDQAFYRDVSQKSDSLNLSEIDDFTISYDNSVENSVRVDIFNAKAEQIKADYTVTPDVITNIKSALLAKTHQISGTVTVNGVSKSYQYTVKNAGDPIELVAEALEAGKITPEEALDSYLEIYETKDYGTCGTYLATQLLSLYYDKPFFSQLSADKQAMLVTRVNPPTYTLEMTYPVSPTYFVVHYEGSGLSGAVPQVVKDIDAALVAAQSEFVSGQGYNKPYSAVGGSQYHVYVVANGSNTPNGWCQPYSYSNATSYVVMNISSLTTSLSTSYKDILNSALTHEYFHAIQNTYRYGFADLPDWFADGFASWASRRQYQATGNGNSEINTFLSQPSVSLPDNQKYGACLFPMFLHKYYGGDAAIKNIMERLPYISSSAGVYDAIAYGLSLSGYYTNFDTVFAEFWAYTYTPHVTYSTYKTGMSDRPATINHGTSYPNNAGPYTVNYLACEFREFTLNPSAACTVNTTINITSGTGSNFRCYLLLSKSTSTSPSMDNVTWYMSSPYTLFTFSRPLASNHGYGTGCIAAENVGKSASIQYKLTVTVT